VVVPAIWAEPFGLVPIEAAAAGVPVVVSRSGGLVEGLREPDEALFFPIGDVSACASAVADTLVDESATAARVVRARARARELGPDRYLAETAAFFAEAVGLSSVPE
jgi:glycogen(starch) synthase